MSDANELFNQLVLDVSIDASITTEIVRLQDRFSLNNENHLLFMADLIAEQLHNIYKDKYPKEVIEKLANYLSGLHFYRVRKDLETINKFLPHLSKFFKGALAQVTFARTYQNERLIENKAKQLYEEIFEGDLSPDEKTLKTIDIQLLGGLKDLLTKKSPMIENLVKKHLIDIEEVELPPAKNNAT